MKAIPIAVLLTFVIILAAPSAHAQPPENFSVAPADFTLMNIPPLGEPYTIEQKLRINNGADVERNFLLSVLSPPPENLEPGYEPIPDENWIILIPVLVPVEANSSSLVEIGFDMPKWENLTNQQWEVWISVKRLAEPGELIEVELISKMYVETTEELPPSPSEGLPLSTIIIAVVVVVAAVTISAWVWWRRKAGSVGGGTFSRS